MKLKPIQTHTNPLQSLLAKTLCYEQLSASIPIGYGGNLISLLWTAAQAGFHRGSLKTVGELLAPAIILAPRALHGQFQHDAARYGIPLVTKKPGKSPANKIYLTSDALQLPHFKIMAAITVLKIDASKLGPGRPDVKCLMIGHGASISFSGHPHMEEYFTALGYAGLLLASAS